MTFQFDIMNFLDKIQRFVLLNFNAFLQAFTPVVETCIDNEKKKKKRRRHKTFPSFQIYA